MPTRRQFVKGGIAVGAAAAIGAPRLLTGSAAAATIDPTTIPKYVTPLFILPQMPPVSTSSAGVVTYSVSARRFTQQVLPAGLPATTVQGFGATGDPATDHMPGYTLEAKAGVQSRVTWVNDFVDSAGDYLPQMLTVDPTLHWSNPPGGVDSRDSTPAFTETPPPYAGPQTLIVHHHGAHDFEESDGHPESWYLPNAKNIPAGHAAVGSFYDQFKAQALARWGVDWAPGTLTSVYPNDQRAMTLWYHDHSLGTTRVGMHSGLVGMSILRGGPSDLPAGVLPGPAPKAGDPAGTKYREICLVLADKTFNTDGSIFFPTNRTDVPGPFIPFSDIPPYWNPVFTGQTITVNGNTWPFLAVEPRRYRFRILNASNIRPYLLKVVSDPAAPRPATPALPIWVIGSDGGFLPTPQDLGTSGLPIFTSERYDVIIDFTGLSVGTTLYLTNEGGGAVVGTTGEVMQFRVVPLTSTDTTTPPTQLSLPGFKALGTPTVTRQISLNQMASTTFTGAIAQFRLGGLNANGTPFTRDWAEPVTETPGLGVTEMWELHNFAAGGHAIHIHLIEFQLVNREPLTGGKPAPPSRHEIGDKDTIFTPPGQITRIKLKMDRQVRMVYHCHFVDHEDHGMMRPFMVV
jgi:bilirubin oxidase